MRNNLFTLGAVWLAVTSTGTVLARDQGNPHPDRQEALVIRGLDPSISVVAELADAFEFKTGQAVEIEGAGSSQSPNAILESDIDLVFIGARVGDPGVTGDGLASVEYARDAVTVLVHPDNPNKELSTEQIGDIFSGRQTQWDNQAPVLAFTTDTWSGSSRQGLKDVVLGDQPFGATVQNIGEQDLLRTVIANVSAIGTLPIGAVVDPGSLAVVTVNGVEPTLQTVRDSSYPLTRSLLFVSKTDSAKNPRAFIDFVLSQEGQQIIRQAGLVPVSGGTNLQTAEVKTQE